MTKYITLIFIALSLVACSSSKKKELSPEKKKARIYYNQGTNELIQHRYTQALKHLLEANALDPENSKILNNLGMAYYFKKRTELAINSIKKAIEIDPKNTEARVNLGTIFTNTDNFIAAEHQYNKVLDDLTYEKQFKTYYNLGVLYLKKNKELEAVNYFKQAINENASYCPAHARLGDIQFKNKDYEQSLKSYRKASLGVCYNDPDPVYRQALSLIKLKKYGSAKLKLEEIIERFSLTPYQELANKKLKTLEARIYSPELKTDGKKRNILSPDF